MDTVEYCDSTELKRVIAMALSISYTLSIFDIDLTKKFWPIIHQCLFIRIGNSIKLLDELSLSFSSSEKKIKTEELKRLLPLFLMKIFIVYLDIFCNFSLGLVKTL